MPRRKNAAISLVKQDKFVELANKRVSAAIDKLRLIGNLSNRKYYEYSDEQIDLIIKRLNEEILSVKQKFNDTPTSNDYSLPSRD